MKTFKRFSDSPARHSVIYFLCCSLALTNIGCGGSNAGPVVENLPAKDKFHIYLLMGQSNMAGRGKVGDEDRPNNPRILSFNREKKWIVASEPLHWDKPAVAGVGPGLAFARAMTEKQPDVTIGLVPCAVGGTPLHRWLKGADLYEAALERAKAAAPFGTIKGVLWHQGEGDANATAAPLYAGRLTGMIGDLRRDLAQEKLLFVSGELGEFRVNRGGPHAGRINEALHAVARDVPLVACVSARDLKDGGDALHFDAASQREFGKRYAQAMLDLLQKAAAPNPAEPTAP